MASPVTGDPRFFRRVGPHGVDAVAAAASAMVAEGAPARDRPFTGIAPLQSAGPDDVTFLDNRRYAAALEATAAGAVIVHPNMRARVPAGCIPLLTTEPYAGWARVAALFHPAPPVAPGIHPSAVIAADARVDPSAEVGPLVVIGARAEVGPRCRIAPGAVIGDGVVLGADCRIGAQASLSHAILGARVYIYPGARIGQEGFGFAITQTGFLTVPQLGRVLIEDDAEIGANTTVDRGSAQDTVIGAGSRLDNLVQIGHNVRLGRGCVVVAQAGISGSAVLGDHVMIGGQAGVLGHLRLGNGARVGAQSGVMSDMPDGAEYVGSPAEPSREFFRYLTALRRLVRDAQGARGGAAHKAAAGKPVGGAGETD